MTIHKEDVLLDTVITPEDIISENTEDIKSKTLDENNMNAENKTFNNLDDIHTVCEEDTELSEKELQVSEESITSNEKQEVFEKKETVETNCLALTVRKNYNISIFKNTVFTTFRVTFKVAVFTFVLNFLSLFF